MVGRLVQPVQDPDGATGLGRSREHGQGEGFLIHHLGATECEDIPARSHLGDGGCVEPLVGAKRIFQGAAMLGECRRIHNHEVILSFRDIPEKIHGIATPRSMKLRPETVQGYIPIHHVHGFPGTVHGIHMKGPAS